MRFQITPRVGDPFIGSAVKIEDGGVIYYHDDSGRHYLAPGEWTRADEVGGGGKAAAPAIATPGTERIADIQF